MDSSVEKSQHRVNTERNGTGEVSQTDRALGGCRNGVNRNGS